MKRYWEFLEEDMLKMFDHFYSSGEISKGCSSAFIILIPKVNNPVILKDYRPITLVGIISKVISKGLAERIKRCWVQLFQRINRRFSKEGLFWTDP